MVLFPTNILIYQKPSRLCNADAQRHCLIATLLTGLLLLSACASKPTPAPPRQAPKKTTQITEPNFHQLIISVEKKHGPIAANRIRFWANLIKQGKHLAEIDKLKQVNNFFNGARFVTDQEAWNNEDYWATPSEFLVRDAGDCEDFAIAKYFTLRFMGIKDKKMRLSYVKSLTLNQPHMVLTYYTSPTEVPLVLDNIERQILPADERDDLVPVYSFNGTTLWLAKTRNTNVKAGNVDNIKPWHTLRSKVDVELDISIKDY